MFAQAQHCTVKTTQTYKTNIVWAYVQRSTLTLQWVTLSFA